MRSVEYLSRSVKKIIVNIFSSLKVKKKNTTPGPHKYRRYQLQYLDRV